METGIDGLRRSVVCSHVREGFGVASLVTGRDGGVDQDVCFDANCISTGNIMFGVDFVNPEKRGQSLFSLSWSIASFSAELLCTPSGRRQLAEGLDSVECRWTVLGGMIGR